MAAPMVKCRICLPRYLYQISAVRHKTFDSVFIAIPDKPDDTPEKNELLRWKEYPPFSKVKPSKIFTGSGKVCIDYEVELGKHMTWLDETKGEKKSFDEVYEPLERLQQPVRYLQSLAWHCARNQPNRSRHYLIQAMKMDRRVENALSYAWVFPSLYDEVKRLQGESSNLTDCQQRLLEKLAFSGMVSGVTFTGVDKLKYQDLVSRCISEQDSFREIVEVSLLHLKPKVDDPRVVQALPPRLQRAISINKADYTRGPWLVPLEENVYNAFMELCESRTQRERVWLAKRQVASVMQNEHHLSNALRIGEVRNWRNDFAELFGYDSHADFVISNNQMVGSVTKLLSILGSLKSAYKDLAKEEVAVLQEYAITRGFQGKLQWWDIPYYRRLKTSEIFRIDGHDLSDYFELEHVVKTSMAFCSKLFGITFTDNTESVDVIHEDVRFYTVTDTASGEELGAFYLDPYSRPGKDNVFGSEAGRDGSEMSGTTPFAYLTFSFQRFGQQPVSMALNQLHVVFGLFGRTLQHILSRTPYSDLSGIRYMEEDAAGVVPSLFVKFLNNKTVLKSFSRHIETNEPIPDHVIDEVLAESQYMTSLTILEQVFLASVDVEIHLNDDEDWDDTYKRMFNDCMPLPHHRMDFTPTSMVSAFGTHKGCLTYVPLWNEIVSSELYRVFDKVGFEDLDKLAEVGKRFREDYLTPGSSLSQRETFRQFVGRDPSIEGFVEMYSPATS